MAGAKPLPSTGGPRGCLAGEAAGAGAGLASAALVVLGPALSTGFGGSPGAAGLALAPASSSASCSFSLRRRSCAAFISSSCLRSSSFRRRRALSASASSFVDAGCSGFGGSEFDVEAGAGSAGRSSRFGSSRRCSRSRSRSSRLSRSRRPRGSRGGRPSRASRASRRSSTGLCGHPLSRGARRSSILGAVALADPGPQARGGRPSFSVDGPRGGSRSRRTGLRLRLRFLGERSRDGAGPGASGFFSSFFGRSHVVSPVSG